MTPCRHVLTIPKRGKAWRKLFFIEGVRQTVRGKGSHGLIQAGGRAGSQLRYVVVYLAIVEASELVLEGSSGKQAQSSRPQVFGLRCGVVD